MDSVISTWDGILYSNFPQHTNHPGGGGHACSLPLRRHAGAWGDGWGRSIVVQRLTWDRDFKPAAAGVRPPLAQRTDVAWVELAAPNKTKLRAAWRDLMQMAVDRIAEENSEGKGRLLLILVAGFRWMPFMWDPVEPLLHPELGPLMIKGDGEGERWLVDPRVYMVRREGEAESTSGLAFDPLEAYTLDCWTTDESGTVVNLKNLLWLEELLAAARRKTLAATEESESSTAKE
ncbi:hypothetical protein C8A00DRAFT_17864 [Chaetomidium leptoderma]|uniref:Uncharacterized protein n=1 Tax=Chaetomidium leptoderma TaxID=669021 RepID=A0AAN6VG53_9PEZI|nr:hypothetical protein C8A00DRAFT_17864 [Chaetomidium leptoderma]